MIGFLQYLLKASICLILFYGLFAAVFRNRTFFLLNRIFLVTGLILSFIIPLTDLSVLNLRSAPSLYAALGKFSIDQEDILYQPQILLNGKTTLNFALILPVIYWSVITALFMRSLLSIIKTIGIIRDSKTFRHGKFRIVRTDAGMLFTFFNLIFLPIGECNPLILEHEIAHIRQMHWLDLLLAEIVSLLLWFNPFTVLYKRSLKLQHEYLADHKVIKETNRIENYLECMLNRIQYESFNGLVNPFYCKTIKKRIIMITKNRTSVKSLGLYILILPLIGLLLLAFTTSPYKTEPKSAFQIVGGEDGNMPKISPVDESKVSQTSGYGERLNPLTGKKDFHKAIDFAASTGEKVVSTAKGVVIEAKFDTDKGMGNYVLIRHDNTYSTFYSHLKSFTVKPGDPVEMGQLIGYVGNTGLSKGPHLHYEVIKNGERVNPADYIPKMN